MNFPGQVVTTNMRIKQLAAYLHRRWFGRPTDDWLYGKDGEEAFTRDKRGNSVHLTQDNWRPVKDWLLPVRTGVCACGRPPIVGLAVCDVCQSYPA